MNKLLTIILLFSVQIALSQSSVIAKRNYHQFDFWLGHWDIYKFGTDTIVGESYIESVIDSVGILENYTAAQSKYRGKSLNKYNPVKNRWEQYWIDNSGLTLYLSGGIENNKMVMTDTETGDAEKGFNRIVWEKLAENRVRQTWTISKDKGKTWISVFDGEYKRRLE